MEKTSTKTLIKNANLAGNGIGWLLFSDERIVDTALGECSLDVDADTEVIDAAGMLLMPGAIDCHVHMRDPGLTHKGDIDTETYAAVAGGVTSVLDMPNTVPQTVTIEAWSQKNEIAAKKAHANYAFFIGATANNLDELLAADYSQVPGVKLFMGSSTGGMLVDNPDVLDNIFAKIKVPVVVHAEDEAIIADRREQYKIMFGSDPIPVEKHTKIRPVEACVAATERAIDLAKRYGTRLHIAHLTTAREVEMVALAGPNVTCEVSPHHLLWCDTDYEKAGSRIKMNPSVKSYADRNALRRAVRNDLVDIIATDHAPHTLAEKQGDALTAMSGAPMVQFSLPTILTMFGVNTALKLMCENPARLFGIVDRGTLTPGSYADIVLLRRADWRPDDVDVLSRCHWTPLQGCVPLAWQVVKTWVNGTQAYPITGAQRNAKPLVFKQ